MTFRIVFHVGESSAYIRQDFQYRMMHIVWPMFKEIEEAKYRFIRPKEVQLAGEVFRTIHDHQVVMEIVHIGECRRLDPEYQGQNIFIPVGVEVVHIWITPGYPVPWSKEWPSGKKFHRAWSKAERELRCTKYSIETHVMSFTEKRKLTQ